MCIIRIKFLHVHFCQNIGGLDWSKLLNPVTGRTKCVFSNRLRAWVCAQFVLKNTQLSYAVRYVTLTRQNYRFTKLNVNQIDHLNCYKTTGFRMILDVIRK